jgi:hypothetical protein
MMIRDDGKADFLGQGTGKPTSSRERGARGKGRRLSAMWMNEGGWEVL